MKKYIGILSLVLLLTGCLATENTAFSSAASTSAPASAPASVEKSQLTVIIQDCSPIQIRESADAKLAFSDPDSLYRYTVTETAGGSATVTIAPTPNRPEGEQPDKASVLTVPLGAYSLIQAELRDAGVSFFPQKADYAISGTDSALSAILPAPYQGRFSLMAEDSALSVDLAGKNQSFKLSLAAQDSAVDAPSHWNYKQGKSFSLTRGKGAAALNFQVKDCAATFRETTGFLSRYAGQSLGTSMSTSSDSSEMVLGNSGYGYGMDALKKEKAAAKPNGQLAVKTIPAAGIRGLQVNANLCGIILQPWKEKHFALSYQGVTDPRTIGVSTEVKDGLLTVTGEGTLQNSLYINASPDFRVNCVLLQVPDGILSSLSLDCGEGIILSEGLTLPAVNGGTERGMIKLKAKTISAPIVLSTKSGDICLSADRISAAATLDSTNGSIEVNADLISGETSLTTVNGHVELNSKTAEGGLNLTAKNGCVQANVDSIKNGSFQAENGDVSVVLGTIRGDVNSSVRNGTMDVTLTRKPADLTFRLTGDWLRNLQDLTKNKGYSKEELPAGLPDGWYDGMVLGNGRPTLTISAEANGDLLLACPPK